MRLINCNVNGLRAAVKKGFLEWVSAQNADIICLQETRLGGADTEIVLPGYHAYYAHADKLGYSGVALWTKRLPDRVVRDWGYAISNTEGRYLAGIYGSYHVASLYMPSGTSGELRQEEKYRFMAAYWKYMEALAKESDLKVLVSGDWNIAHTTRDLKAWKTNQKSSGFLPEERAWIDALFQKLGYKDAFRLVNDADDVYSWWSQRSRTARMNNVGWRIDYQVISPALAPSVRAATICKDPVFSDHAPVIIDYDLPWD